MSGIKRGLQWAAAGGLRLPGVRQAARAAARCGLLPRAVWRRLPVTGAVPVRLPGGIDLAYQSGLMDHLGRILFFAGPAGWEPEVVRVLPALAARAAGVLDVGSHTGLFTLIALAANPAASAVAVEPLAVNAKLLTDNLRANRMSGRCVVSVTAAAAAPGLVAFDAGPVEVSMTASIAQAGANGVRVPAVSIDAVADWLPSVDLVKIDVEGFEHLVLEGGRETLTRYRPTLVVECLPGSRVEDFADLWGQLGYHRFHLLPDRVVPVPAVRPTADALTHNYLFAARPDVLAEVVGSDPNRAAEAR